LNLRPVSGRRRGDARGRATSLCRVRFEQVKKIRRRVRDGLRLTDHALEYQAKRKTLRRRIDALERAEAERDGAPCRRARRREASSTTTT
jgi:hypothetical protein